MFSLNLSEIITFRKCYLLTVSGVLWVLVFACGFLFCCCCFFPPSLLQHSFQSHLRATERSCTFDIPWVNTRFPTFTLEQTSLRKTVLTVSLIMNSLSKRNYWIYPCMDFLCSFCFELKQAVFCKWQLYLRISCSFNCYSLENRLFH